MSVASVGYTLAPQPMHAEPRAHAARQAGTVKPEIKAKPQAIQSAASDLQRMGSVFNNRKLRFVVDHNSNQVTVKVIDKETDKVIRELPPEELQRLHRNLKEAIGLLFNEMA